MRMGAKPSLRLSDNLVLRQDENYAQGVTVEGNNNDMDDTWTRDCLNSTKRRRRDSEEPWIV